MARPSLIDEHIRAAVLGKCWQFLAECMDSETMSEDRKLDIALRLCAKNTPQDIDMSSGGEPFTLIIKRANEAGNGDDNPT